MNSNVVYFYLVTALAYITVCRATGLDVFPVRLGDDSKPTSNLVDITGPVPDLPKVGTWSYPKTGVPWVMVQFAIQMNLSYVNMDNNTMYTLYNIPAEETAVINGTSSNDTQSIILQWNENAQLNNLTIEFGKNSTASQFSLLRIAFDLMLDNKTFPSISVLGPVTFEHKKSEFTTPLDMSYHCTKPQHFNFTTNAPTPVDYTKINATIVISHMQLEAFNTKSNQFATAKDCDAIDTPDIVPIAVGCALAGLIVIVLIAYLVGRRRAQARGYLSM